MEALAAPLEGIGDALAAAEAALTAVVRAALGDDQPRDVTWCGATGGEEAAGGTASGGVLAGASDDGLLRVLSRAARLGRLVDAVLVEAAGQVRARCDSAARADRMTTAYGCRDVNELIRRATRASARRAAELQRAAVGVRRPVSPTSGGPLPATYPALRHALAGGDVAAEALAGVFRVLDDALPAVSSIQRLAADTELAAAASGTTPGTVGPDSDGDSADDTGADGIGRDAAGGQPPAGCDELRLQAQVWAAVLDPDGAEPRDEQAQRRRGLRLGGLRDGLVPLHGDLLPDVAAQLQRLFDAIENPKTRGPVFTPADDPGPTDDTPPMEADRRTVPQLHHDSLAAILLTAAGSADTPTLGGAAPTLTIAVTAETLTTGCGIAHLDGTDGPQPVPPSVARHAACVGRVECTTFDSYGRILAIHVHDRLFTPWQRRAIALRDGGCVIPGCHVRAAWCEVHHVQEWARGGPTHTDNGVLLCWFHHRTIDTAGWHIRIRHGTPEIQGPTWWDPQHKWRPTTPHPARARPNPHKTASATAAPPG